jgi:hypothetical protein
VVLAPDDLICFGFYNDFRTLKIESTGSEFPETWDLSDFYEAWVEDSRILTIKQLEETKNEKTSYSKIRFVGLLYGFFQYH